MLSLASLLLPTYFPFKINTEEINGPNTGSLRHFSPDCKASLVPSLHLVC